MASSSRASASSGVHGLPIRHARKTCAILAKSNRPIFKTFIFDSFEYAQIWSNISHWAMPRPFAGILRTRPGISISPSSLEGTLSINDLLVACSHRSWGKRARETGP